MKTIKSIAIAIIEIVIGSIHAIAACVLSVVVFLIFYGLIRWFVMH